MKWTELSIKRTRRDNVEHFAIELTYIPNSYVGEVKKQIGDYTSFHEAWQALKELEMREVNI